MSSTFRLTVGAPALVLQEWAETPGPDGTLVTIRGRKAGVLSWLLHLVGLESTVTLLISREEVELSVASWFGDVYRRLPVTNIASTASGFSRPLHWVLAGAVLLVDMVRRGEFLWHALLILACVVAYFLGRAAFLAIESAGGAILAIRYTGSAIHGTSVEPAAARRVTRLLGDLVMRRGIDGTAVPVSQAVPPPSRSSSATPAPEPPQPSPPPPPSMAYCGRCGRQGIVGSSCPTCGGTID